MTIEEKKTVYEKYIGKTIFMPIKDDNHIITVSDTLKSIKILEEYGMIVAYLDNIKYAVNVDILSIQKEDNTLIHINDIEFPVPQDPDIKIIVI